MRILIAEDEAVSRRLLEKVLTDWGHTVEIAHDGREALAKLQCDDAPHMAILDWVMPEMDGVEVCRAVRAQPHRSGIYTYIILLTSKDAHADLISGLEAGADDYIRKPFEREEFRVRLNAGIRITQLQTDLREARRTLEIQATHDSLTGILNRNAILDHLHVELARITREHGQLYVGLLDIDHFKDINDTLGHLAGDIVLRACVQRIKGAMRSYDDVGRFGGEEFLLVVPGLGSSDVPSVFERIREAVTSQPIVVNNECVTVTVSIGVAATSGQVCAEDLLKRADKVLYQAKAAGRNRVLYADSRSTPVHE